jgi:hypothetical protein
VTGEEAYAQARALAEHWGLPGYPDWDNLPAAERLLWEVVAFEKVQKDLTFNQEGGTVPL